MSSRYRDCINKRYLRECAIDENKVKREVAEAKNDLESAKLSLKESDYKWAIIQGYFSMFHAGKSLLYSVGYDEKSHECVIIAVEELFTATGKLPSSIVSNIRNAKSAREAADYGCTYGVNAAQGIIQDAEEAIRIISSYHNLG